MGNFTLHQTMKIHITAALFASVASANILIKSEEAKQLIHSRVRRWGRSNMQEECFSIGKTCSQFEEFAEGAENVYGKKLIRRDDRTKEAFNNFYQTCHYDKPFCKNNDECRCNKQFKNWLKNPRDETWTTTTTTTTTTPEATTTKKSCGGWFSSCDDEEEDDKTTAKEKTTAKACGGLFQPACEGDEKTTAKSSATTGEWDATTKAGETEAICWWNCDNQPNDDPIIKK